MKIVGYADRLSVAPGEEIRFMISSQLARYRAELVQLIHGDVNPQGPGFKERHIPRAIDAEYPGRTQTLALGSAILVPDRSGLNPTGDFTLAAWIWPTLPDAGPQALLGRWSEAEPWGLRLGLEGGELCLRLAGLDSRVQRLASGAPLRARTWYFVAASYDAESGRARLVQRPVEQWPGDTTAATVEGDLDAWALGAAEAPLAMAAEWMGEEGGRPRLRHHYNGKLEAPRLFAATLDAAQLDALAAGADPRALGARLVAAWDFAPDTQGDVVRDVGPNGLHGRTVNLPTRAMAGHAHRGVETNWQHAPADYGAIHFHDDDLADAGWEADFVLTVPPELPSGVYAAKLTGEGAEDYIPFFVRPRDRVARAPILWLVPTNSYLAYANVHLPTDPVNRAWLGYELEYPVQEQDKYILASRLHSLYDKHSDGSGVCYSSRLRPIVNLRPKVVHQTLDEGRGQPHQFNADLHLVDWLTEQGFAFDVATDEDLEQEGLGLLSQYQVVVTGTHHEYWTAHGLDALEGYLGRGGKFMNLAGNGYYWVTSFLPAAPQTIEVRRWGGTQSWSAEPGEYHHSGTGELGGLWRERRRPPNRLVGVGFAAQGNGPGRPFRREPGSFDPRASWIFEGIGPDEVIGDFGLVVDAAGGYEFDRLDYALGSPPHALVLATASGFGDDYQYVVEEVEQSDSRQGGSVNPRVRADLVFFETPNGGAVFSAPSISWCGSLSHNGYDNNVSRITANVLRRFLDPRGLGRRG